MSPSPSDVSVPLVAEEASAAFPAEEAVVDPSWSQQKAADPRRDRPPGVRLIVLCHPKVGRSEVHARDRCVTWLDGTTCSGVRRSLGAYRMPAHG